eukprot:7230429-Karenia_brevis.AAC.1
MAGAIQLRWVEDRVFDSFSAVLGPLLSIKNMNLDLRKPEYVLPKFDYGLHKPEYVDHGTECGLQKS